MKTILASLLMGLLLTHSFAQSGSSALPIQKALSETMIEEVKLEKASLDLWVAFLRNSVKVGVETPVNVVIPPEVRDRVGDQTVTLNLKKVPAAAVLKYCTQLSGITYKIEPRAIVLVP